MNILPTYLVTEDSLFIKPSKQIGFGSIVKEMEITYHVAQTPLEIIKHSCLRYNSTYEGRRLATINNTHFRRMVPICMCELLGIYAFPTHATNSLDCCWIFLNNIADISKHKDAEGEQVIVIFKNESSIVLQMPMHSFERQLGRTYFMKERLKR